MPDPEQLRKQLDEIEIHWNSLRVEFAGPAPGPSYSEADWSSAAEAALVSRLDPKLPMDFSQARHSVVKQLRGLIWGQLQPWVAAVILEHGLPVDKPLTIMRRQDCAKPSVSAVARQLSQKTGVTIAPHVISTLFYKRRLDDTRCPVVCGHRQIPDDYTPAIEQALRDTGVLPAVEATSA